MSANGWIAVLCAVWAALVGAGFLHSNLGTPTGDGFVRGMNLLLAFLGWQTAAILLSAGIFGHWLLRRTILAPWARVLGLVPPIVSLIAILAVIFWFATAA